MSLERSTNPQISQEQDADKVDSEQKKIDRVADDLAGKASRVQHHDESSINDGGVSPGGGGIFSK